MISGIVVRQAPEDAVRVFRGRAAWSALSVLYGIPNPAPTLEAVTCPRCGCTVGLDCADIRLQAEAFADYETRGGPLAFDAWVATKDHDPRTAALIRHELKAARVRVALDRGARRYGAP